MGLFDSIAGGTSRDGEPEGKAPDSWAIVCRAPDGTRHSPPDAIEDGDWRWSSDPPNKEQFRFQYGDVLEEGITYECVPHYKTESGSRPDFEGKKWTHEVEARRQTDDEEAIRRAVREEMGDGPAPEVDSIEEALIYEVRQDEGAKAALEELKDLEQRKEGGRKNFFEDADLDNQKEIVAAAFMNMMESYDSVGEAVEDVFSGVLRSADGTARVGPTAEPGNSQQRQQQQTQQPEPEPEPEAASSPAKEAFEEATQEAEEEEPERRLDLTADADRQSAGEMAEELGVSEEEQPAEGDETDQEAETDAEPVEAEADPGGMSAQPIGPEPEEEAEETVTEGEIVEDSTVPAEPAVVERAASDGGEEEPERCEFVKDDGERCGNPAGEDGYCHVEGHGPDDEAEEPQGVEA